MLTRLRKLGISLSISISAIVISLLIAELVVRSFMPQAIVVPWQDEISGITGPRPNAKGRHYVPDAFDVEISFSSQRFRGEQEVDKFPAADVLRLAVLGDSFAYGYGANDDETYPVKLEESLREWFAAKGRVKDVEVINAANGGTGTGEQARWYDLWVKDFHPDIVVLTVTGNDVEDDFNRRMFALGENDTVVPIDIEILSEEDSNLRQTRAVANAIPFYSFLAQHSHLVNLLRNSASRIVAQNKDGDTTESLAESSDNIGKVYELGLPLLGGIVDWLNNIIDRQDAKLVVVFVPSRHHIYPLDTPRPTPEDQPAQAIVDTLKETADQKEIPFLNLVPVFLLTASGRPDEPLFYCCRDTHPNLKGYSLIGKSVADFIVSQDLVADR